MLGEVGGNAKLTTDAQMPDPRHTRGTPWYASWKAHILGIAGIISAIVIFSNELKLFIRTIEEFIPHDLAVNLPYSQTKIRDEEVRNVLLSRYASDNKLESIFGNYISLKTTNYHNIVVRSSVYKNYYGTLVISRVADAIVSWSLAPKIIPYVIAEDLERSHLSKSIAFKSLEKYYGSIDLIITEINSQKQHTAVSFSALPFDGSPNYYISYSFYPKLNCGSGILSENLYAKYKSIPCSKSESMGVITMISYTQVPDLFELSLKDKNINFMEIFAQVNQTAIDGTQMVIRDALTQYLRTLN